MYDSGGQTDERGRRLNFVYNCETGILPFSYLVLLFRLVWPKVQPYVWPEEPGKVISISYFSPDLIRIVFCIGLFDLLRVQCFDNCTGKFYT